MTEPKHDTSDAGDTEDALLTLDEAIKFLDTSKSTLYRLLSQNDLKGVKVGKQWRFRRADLTAYLERGAVAVAVDAEAQADLEAELAFFDATDLPAPFVGDRSSESRVAGVVALADRIIVQAVASRASDIHLEPAETALRLRYRIDGVLHEVRRLPMRLHEPLLARFKELADMNPLEKRLPQDGRCRIPLADSEYDLRMNVLPTLYGENVVIRILDRSSVLLGLENLGTDPQELAAVRAWMRRPGGMILATGPTGSGKTTLLYSCLQEVDTEQRKVLTAEDPVEYRLPDVAQTQINRRLGLTYAAALRTFLRQDPDVILCAQMRDLETAEIAIEAALTGHLVLTALHTEDAPTVLLRLVDMGLERYLVTATLHGVVALRLARKLCPECRVPLSEGEVRPVLERVRPLSEAGGYPVPSGARFFGAAGCAACRRTGYRGRVGLYEILECDPRLVGRLYQCATNTEMTQLAVASGMRTLLADGMRKAVARETTIDEVLRATGTWF